MEVLYYFLNRGKFVKCNMFELELIKWLVIEKDRKINYWLFLNLIGFDEYYDYVRFYIVMNILREKLGFNKYGKFGDIDILIILVMEYKVYFERICVIEVKVVRFLC